MKLQGLSIVLTCFLNPLYDTPPQTRSYSTMVREHVVTPGLGGLGSPKDEEEDIK